MRTGYTVLNTVPLLQDKERIFHQLLQYKKKVFFICLGYTVDSYWADELVQEIYVKAWTRLGSLRHQNNLKAWLLTLARNTCLDFLRKEKVKKLFLMDFRPGQSDSKMVHLDNPEERHISNEDRIRLKKTIRKLPDKLRQVIILKEYGEFSCEQIASLLGVKLGTVHSRLGRARARVIKNMGGSHG